MIQTVLACGFMSIYCLLLYSFLGRGQTFIQLLRAKKMFIVSMENSELENRNPSLCMYYRSTPLSIPWELMPSGFVLLYCMQTSGFG